MRTSAKAHVVGVDEAACISFPIHHTKVHCVCASSVRVQLHIMARVSRQDSGSLSSATALSEGLI